MLNKFCLKALFCIVLVAFFFNQPQATIIHVPTDSSTIQGGINGAVNGDTVAVAAGTYYENLVLLSGVTLLGGYNISDWSRDVNRQVTTIKGNGGATVVTMNDIQDVIVDGFRITNAGVGVGAAKCPRVVVSNNEIYGCNYGVFMTADVTYGIGSFLIANNIIHDNNTGLCFKYFDWPYIQIMRNNLCYNNNYYGIDPMELWNLKIINNTVVQQSGDGIFSVVWHTGSLVRNNIIAFNDGCGLISWYDLEYVPHDYNDVFGNGTNYCKGFVPDTTEISADPLFANPAIADYHLLLTSPCIDAGHPDSIYNDPDGSRNDMGAFGGPGAADWVIRPLPTYLRGDANGDGMINAADVVYLINYLFIHGPAPVPLAAGDATCDGVVDASDVVYLINYLFVSGPAPGCH
jgi:hypothetical protein